MASDEEQIESIKARLRLAIIYCQLTGRALDHQYLYFPKYWNAKKLTEILNQTETFWRTQLTPEGMKTGWSKFLEKHGF